MFKYSGLSNLNSTQGEPPTLPSPSTYPALWYTSYPGEGTPGSPKKHPLNGSRFFFLYFLNLLKCAQFFHKIVPQLRFFQPLSCLSIVLYSMILYPFMHTYFFSITLKYKFNLTSSSAVAITLTLRLTTRRYSEKKNFYAEVKGEEKDFTVNFHDRNLNFIIFNEASQLMPYLSILSSFYFHIIWFQFSIIAFQ